MGKRVGEDDGETRQRSREVRSWRDVSLKAVSKSEREVPEKK